jgi:ABC-type nitrate/sulfonate/bicarbonate transport system permease component
MGASERRLLWDTMLPAALPQILTGLQVALPIALIVEIATEMIMGGTGIGGAMLQASRMFESPKVFAGIVEISLAGYCVIKGMALLRRRLLLWHQETAHQSGL